MLLMFTFNNTGVRVRLVSLTNGMTFRPSKLNNNNNRRGLTADGSNSSITYLMPTPRRDGIGSHLINGMLAALFASVDSPNMLFAIPSDVRDIDGFFVEHNYDGVDGFAQSVHDFIGLHKVFPLHCDDSNSNSIVSPINHSTNFVCKHMPVLESMNDMLTNPDFGMKNIKRYFSGRGWVVYNKIVDAWRQDKDEWADRVLGRDGSGRDVIHIAVHIRRLNPHDDRVDGSNIHVSEFINRLRNCNSFNATAQIVVHIFSQGEECEFVGFRVFVNELIESGRCCIGSCVRLHLCTDLFDTFVGLAMADVLIGSPSGLSVAAGLYSKGIVYPRDGWYFSLPHWRRMCDLDAGVRISLDNVYARFNNRVRIGRLAKEVMARRNGKNWKKMMGVTDADRVTNTDEEAMYMVV